MRNPYDRRQENGGLSLGCVVLMLLLFCVALCAGGFAVWGVFIYNPAPRLSWFRRPRSEPIVVATPPQIVTEPVTATPLPSQTFPSPTASSTAGPSLTPTARVDSPTAVSSPTMRVTSGPIRTIPTIAATPGITIARRSQGLRMNSPEYGMQAFLWWRAETADRDLKLIKEAGFNWVKQIFAWRDIEGSGKNQFDWERPDRIIAQVEQYGLDLIARIDSQPAWAGGGYPGIGPPDRLQDYADFLYAFASRYKGRVRAYQVWNEPNLSREWGEKPPDPKGYTELLKVAYEAIKRADPNAMVISAGLAPTTRFDDVAMPDIEFLRGMYAAGAKPYFDVLGVHGAGYKVAPETDPNVVANDPVLYNGDPSPVERRRIYCFRRVEDMRQVMVDNGDQDKQVALLEFGWTSDSRPDSPYHWHAVSEQEKADYFVRAYQYAKEHWSPWIGVMSLIYMPYPEWTKDDEKWWWAIIEPRYPELRLRPAYVELKMMPKN